MSRTSNNSVMKQWSTRLLAAVATLSSLSASWPTKSSTTNPTLTIFSQHHAIISVLSCFSSSASLSLPSSYASIISCNSGSCGRSRVHSTSNGVRSTSVFRRVTTTRWRDDASVTNTLAALSRSGISSVSLGMSRTKKSSSSTLLLNENNAPLSFSSSRPVKKVAIIGGGISGLSLAHALRSENMMLDVVEERKKRQQQVSSSSAAAATTIDNTTTSSTLLPTISIIDIFESRSSFISSSSKASSMTGSGIQLTGGMAALHRINPQLQTMVSEAALPLDGVVSYCRPWFRLSSTTTPTTPGGDEKVNNENDSNDDTNNNGWKILELNVRRAILEQEKNEQEKKEKEETSRAKGRFMGANNDVLEENNGSGNGNDDVGESDGGKRDKTYGLVTPTGEILAYTILRSTLQHILRSALQREYEIPVQFDKRLIGLSYSEDEEEVHGSGIHCHFADGSSSGPYDVVVGCDGIGSAVREYVNTGSIDNSSTKKVSSAIYSGLRITFAIQDGEGEEVDIENEVKEVDADVGDEEEEGALPSSCQFNQFFGNGAYALTSSYGAGKGRPPTKGAFLVYPDPNYIGPFPRRKGEFAMTTNPAIDETTKHRSSLSTSSIIVSDNDNNRANTDATNPLPDENPDWSQDNRVTKQRILECLQILQNASMPGKDVSTTIEKSTRFFDLGVYLHNPFSWNGWVREVVVRDSVSGGNGDDRKKRRKTGAFVVTAGDASHAMPPFLGQGANQALQDSCALAAKIFEYNYDVQYASSMSSSLSSITTGEIIIPSQPDLKKYLKEYESLRWLPTTSLTIKAAILGYLEVGPWLLGNVRDVFFFVMGKAGVAKKIFLDAATPKM